MIAKGQEVTGIGDWTNMLVNSPFDERYCGADERRLLYVAMTRARQMLVLMRAEGGRNPYLVDLARRWGFRLAAIGTSAASARCLSVAM